MKLIAAADRSNGIGKDGHLLYDIPQDMKYFKELTIGKTVIMGRKTYETLPNKKPLCERTNIVLTTNMDFTADGFKVCHDLNELFKALIGTDPEDVFVIGGGEIYRQLIGFCDTAYITRIDEESIADTFLPDLDELKWERIQQTKEFVNGSVVYRFEIYKNKLM